MGQKRAGLVAAVACVGSLLFVAPAMATDPGTNVANFSESRGCAPNTRGTARPYVGSSMSTSTLIRGPWGDMFGRNYYQVAQSLVQWRLPGTSKVLRAHQRMLPALDEVKRNLEADYAAGRSYYVYSAGSFVWRTVGGSTQPSEHAFGTAFDINPSQNPYSSDNYLRTNMPDWFVEAFTDAGFCWGGQWVDKKDAMHFSWSGPVVTPGSERPAPYPPVTNPTGFRGPMLAFQPATGAIGDGRLHVADMTGEGAPEVVRVSANGRVEAAAAIGDYRTIAVRTDVAGTPDDVLVGDYDLDGRSDIWVVDRSGPTIAFDIHTSVDDHELGDRVTTNVPSSVGTVLLGHFDDDFVPDVYALTGSVFDVYGSDSGYSGPIAAVPRPAGSTSLVVGDHDLDGKADIYGIRSGADATIVVSLGGGGSVSLDPDLAIPTSAAAGIGDYDGDGRDDLFVIDGTGALEIAMGGWTPGAPDAWFQNSKSVAPDAGPECLGASCDTIGYVSQGGEWFISDRPRTVGDVTEFFYGNPADAPFMGDWDCDGIDTPGLYRRSDGYVYLRNSNTQGIADLEFYFGNPSDIPLIGDFDGDGCDSVSIFRPSEQRIYIIDQLGADGAGLGAADRDFAYGDFGDVPFVGDFDGDGKDEIGLHRPGTGLVLLRWEVGPGVADAAFAFGGSSDRLIAGDWNGDGIDTVAAYRESVGNWYIRLSNTSGAADHVIHFHDHDGSSSPVSGRAFG